MQVELDRRSKEDEEQRMLEDEEAKQRAVKDFELLQMGLEIRNSRENKGRNVTGVAPKVVGRENGKIVLEQEIEANGDEAGGNSGSAKRKFELDEEELMRLARDERKKARAALSEEKVSDRPPRHPIGFPRGPY